MQQRWSPLRTRGIPVPVSREQVESETLETFQEELPSVYYSDKPDEVFFSYLRNAEFMYRRHFKFPPQMFSGASLIDFGAGTGENTVYLARWGATCTLVEMNPGALEIARSVFDRFAPGGASSHRFIESSIFGFEEDSLYDIVHCRGVLSHTAAKEEAFQRIARHVRPGGYLIFGDPNKAGGFQNMLQRYAVYAFADTKQQMMEVSEALFWEDIDRSQAAIPRTRKSIIFDRWVIQQQDDPSVSEVMEWFRSAGLEFYSAYPPFLPPLVGDSVHHPEKYDWASVDDVGVFAEVVWMLQAEGDGENEAALDSAYRELAGRFAALTSAIQNFSARPTMTPESFVESSGSLRSATSELDLYAPIKRRLVGLLEESERFVHAVDSGDLPAVQRVMAEAQHLFRGATGVRHVDFIGYRPQ